MLMSGFAGLGYQIVWTQQCASWLGHESAAVLAVVAAFFGGLAVGAWLLGSRIERSARPALWYAGCELTIALWGFVLVFAARPFGSWTVSLMGVAASALSQSGLAFAATFVLLLPATAAMGATLPAMERVSARLWEDDGSVAALYAANTFGAVLGVLVTAFWMIPALGLVRTTAVCLLLNILCCATSLGLRQTRVEGSVHLPARYAWGVTAQLAAAGFLGIGYEVLVVRVLSQVTENTVYTFALLLSVYLVGSAAGAAIYGRCLRRGRDEARLSGTLPVALSLACLLGTSSLWGAEWLAATARTVLGGGGLAAVASEAVPALFAFGPATIAMGAYFSHLMGQARAIGLGFGRALAANTLGAAAAPGLFGVLFAPALGAGHALLATVVGYLALVPSPSRRRPMFWLPVAGATALACFAPPLAFVQVPPGGRIIRYEEGAVAAVSVVEDVDGEARLRINNRAQEGSNRTQRVDGRQAWLPLLLHPAPRRALFLGLGTGVTASSAAEDPTLEVDAVELLREVIAVAPYFAGSVADGAAFRRLHVVAADARRYVRASPGTYDVIVADNFHPARSGSGVLYTVEHFEAVRERLTPSGVFCQWLPLHQLDRETLRSIVGSFLVAYPYASAMIANNSLETPVFGLVGRRGAQHFDPLAVRQRLRRLAVPDRVSSLGLEDEFAVLGGFVAGAESLRGFSGGVDLNTDDRPVVAYRAPGATYAPESAPGERLIALLRELALESGEVFASPPEPGWNSRLGAYFLARNRFIELGRGVRPRARVEEMLAQVQEPLLSVLRVSPDFRPAYDPLLAMAEALAASDVQGARRLVTQLIHLQPARPEAERLLDLLAQPR